MARKYNLTAIVVFITIVEGLAVPINMVLHPTLPPALTAVVVAVAKVANGLVVWYFLKIHTDLQSNTNDVEDACGVNRYHLIGRRR